MCVITEGEGKVGMGDGGGGGMEVEVEICYGIYRSCKKLDVL